MKLKLTYKGNTLIASVIGELDHHSSEHIRQKVDSEMIKSTTRNIVFDFSEVTFMDSSGIGVVMGRYRNIKNLNGKLAVANINQQIKRIFDMSGLHKIIPVYDSIDTAINKM